MSPVERTLLAVGREAEVYLEPDGRVLKLYFEPGDSERAAGELTLSTALRAAGHPVPAILGSTVVDGRPGVLMERLIGSELLAALERRPQRILTAAGVLATTHAEMHALPAPDVLPDLVDVLRRRITHAGLLSDPQLDQVLTLLDALPRGNAVCHGDFHLANMFGTWDDVTVIDWAGSARGHHLADVARTELLHRTATLPPGTSAVLRTITRLGRGLLVDRYLARYAGIGDLDRDLLAKWYVIAAAARLSEGITEENEALLALVDAWCRSR